MCCVSSDYTTSSVGKKGKSGLRVNGVMDNSGGDRIRGGRREEKESEPSGIKKGCLSMLASVQEGMGYCKAFVVGKGKKLTARNEEEATEADLQTAKMEVDAADAAEHTKNQLRHHHFN
ncbi:hypothetical protein Ancab_029002 [Ancistrocladus abbreviatus]